MNGGAEAWRLALGLMLLVAVAWTPGFVLHRLLLPGRGRAEGLAAAPALSAGVLYVLGEGLSALELRVDARLALGVASVAALVLITKRGRLLESLDRWSTYGVLAAIGLGTTLWSLGIRHWRAVPPHNDGYNHGFFIRRIVETHSLDPARVMPHDVLLGGHGVGYYPLALHQQAAVLVQVLHLDVATAWTLTSLSTTVIALPLGMLMVGRHVFQGLPLVAAACAVVSALVPGLTYSTSWWGGYALAAGFAATPGALILVLRAVERRGPASFAAAVLGLAGVAGMHTSEYSLLLVLAGVLVLARAAAHHSVRAAVAEGTSLVIIALGSLTVLAPALAQLRRGLQERAYPLPEHGVPLWTAIREVIVQFSFVPPVTPPAVVLAFLGGMVACLVTRRALSWVTAWATFAMLYVWLATHPDGLVTSLTATWYSDRFRVAYILAFLGIPIVAFAIGGASAAARRELRLIGPTLGVVLLVTSSTASVHSIRQNYQDFSLVGADERAAFAYLAQHVRPDEHVVNQHQDGSPWMYSLDRVAPVEALKTFDFDRPEWRDATYLARHLPEAGRNAEVDRLLAGFRARYAYVGPAVFPTEQADIDRAALARSSAWRLVFARGSALVYERVR